MLANVLLTPLKKQITQEIHLLIKTLEILIFNDVQRKTKDLSNEHEILKNILKKKF